MHFTCTFELGLGEAGHCHCCSPKIPLQWGLGAVTLRALPSAMLSDMTHGSHIFALSSSPQGEKRVQQAPCFCRVGWGGLVSLGSVCFAYAVVFPYFK